MVERVKTLEEKVQQLEANLEFMLGMMGIPGCTTPHFGHVA